MSDPAASPDTPEPADHDFNAIEHAVMETPRGRWFLKEFARRNRTADTERLLDAIEKLGGAQAQNAEHSRLDILRRELQEMSASIEQTRSEIAAIKPEDAGDNRIMAATEELDAIVTATERATSDILGAAERLQEVGEKLRAQGADDDLCDEIDGHATEIFMACSFQDITGQRTTKVVQVLHYLEQRVNSMIQIWGVEGTQTDAIPDIKDQDQRPDAHLLNGPQMEGDGVAQDDIDAMLQSADPDEPAETAETPSENAAGEEPPNEEIKDEEIAGEEVTGEDGELDIDALFK